MKCSKNTNHSNLQTGRLRKDSIGYMPGLDGLRALAVFAVIAYHLNFVWAPGGLLGVSLFFVLSGYLITNILLTQWQQTGTIHLKDFWLRRIRRLIPALFVMLTGVMSWIAVFDPERLATLKQEVLAAVFYTSNWYLIFHQVSYFEQFGPQSPLGHLWSLAVEEQFYLFWPLLLGLGLRYLPQRKWLIRGTVAVALLSATAMALIYVPGNDPSRVYYGTDTRAFALLVGAVSAMLWPAGRMNEDLSCKTRLALDSAGSMGLSVVLLMMWKTNQYQTFLYQGGLLLFSVAAACLVVVLAHPGSNLGKLFGWGSLRWLGECSYGIYLWHYPVIALTSPAVNTEGTDLSLSLWQITVSIILAVVSRYLVEEPIRYGYKRRSRQRSELHGRQRMQLRGIKISASILLSFLLMFLSANTGTQILAEELTAQQESKVKQENEAQQENEVQQENEAQQENEVQQENEMQQENEVPVQDEGAQTREPEGEIHMTDGQAESLEVSGDGVTAIGDSLMIDVMPVLNERLPGIVIDGKIGRQMHQAPEVISGLQKSGKLGKIVIIELGTNGSFTEKQLMATLDSLQEIDQIILVNTRVPRPWEAVVNETLTKVAGSYGNTKLIDWYSESSGHNDYFYPDGVHLNREGAKAYGQIIIDALFSEENEEQ